MWADSGREQSNLGESIASTSGYPLWCDTAVAGMESFVYDSTESLKGQAYDALRSRIAANELVVAKGMREFAVMLGVCLGKHSSAIESTIAGRGHLDYDQLQRDIDCCNHRLDYYRELARCFPLVVISATASGHLYRLRDELSLKQQKLLEFGSATTGIYDEVSALVSALRRGVLYCCGMVWDGGGFVPTAGADDLSWRDDLAAARAAIADDLMELARAGVYNHDYGRYGGNQMVLRGYFAKDSPERQQLRDYILAKYPAYAGLDNDQINYLTDKMQSGCGYVAFANEIAMRHYFRPEEFEREFGFPLFREENGERVLNYELLVADLFCYANHNSGDPYAFSGDIEPGRGDGFLPGYMSERSGGAVQVTVDAPIVYDPDFDYGSLLNDSSTVIINSYGESIFIAQDGSRAEKIDKDKGHGTVLTAVDGDLLLVSSWGNEYYVKPGTGIVTTFPETTGTVNGVPFTVTIPPMVTNVSTVTVIHWSEQ